MGFGVVAAISIDASSPFVPLYFEDIGPSSSSCWIDFHMIYVLAKEAIIPSHNKTTEATQ
jgi:hypothetical protein